MTYSLEISDQAREQIDALPPNAASALADVWAFLELTPWAGTSMAEHTAVRNVEFHDGLGLVTYLILEDQRIVDVLLILWL